MFFKDFILNNFLVASNKKKVQGILLLSNNTSGKSTMSKEKNKMA